MWPHLRDESCIWRSLQLQLWLQGTLAKLVTEIIYFRLKLYEDQKTCVLTKEFLEAEEKELEEDFAIPVTIICLVGALGN